MGQAYNIYKGTRELRGCWAMLVAVLLALVLQGCGKEEVQWRIGVSQCSQDIWRDKLNAELRMGAYAYEGLELMFASADDSDERQVRQIDSLVEAGIDLLIVAPNQMATVSPAIDRAYDKGIPVIVYERKTSSRKFTAYMGGDNRLMGRQMGEYVAQRLGGRGRVVEIMGLQGSSPAIERHEGFAEALSRYPGIELVASLQGDWTEQSGYEAMSQWIIDNGQLAIDNGQLTMDNGLPALVFGQNDRMAIGARKAIMERYASLPSSIQSPLPWEGQGVGFLPLFCGIDGLPGEDGGIASVRDSVLEASYVYPTHGDEVLALALDILEGRDFKTDNPLQGTLVTRDNARALLLQADEINRQTHHIDNLHRLATAYNARLMQQRVFTVLAVSAASLLFVALVLFYLYHRSKIAIRRERVLSNVWNSQLPNPLPDAVAATDERVAEAAAAEDTSQQEEAVLEHSAGDGPSLAKGRVSPAETAFITRFREVVDRRMADSQLSVEDLAADMSLSRVQLYRRVKTITGSSPVELLRTARLNRGHQLLLTTDKTVSEVAYAVGFSSPAYFTKCFKDEFGFVPGDAREQV